MPTETRNQCIKRWETSCKKLLEGKEIKRVRYLTDEEVSDLGWNQSTLVCILNDGTCFYPSMDDEGNDAGALFTNSENLPTIPVIR